MVRLLFGYSAFDGMDVETKPLSYSTFLDMIALYEMVQARAPEGAHVVIHFVSDQEHINRIAHIWNICHPGTWEPRFHSVATSRPDAAVHEPMALWRDAMRAYLYRFTGVAI